MVASAWTLLLSVLVSGDESLFAREVEEDGFILVSSASKAGARVFTTASRSDCCVRDCTSERNNNQKKSLGQTAVVSW